MVYMCVCVGAAEMHPSTSKFCLSVPSKSLSSNLTVTDSQTLIYSSRKSTGAPGSPAIKSIVETHEGSPADFLWPYMLTVLWVDFA